MAPVPEASICCSGVMPPPGLGDIFSAMALSPCNAQQGMLEAGGSLSGDEVPREPPRHPHSSSARTGVPRPLRYRCGTWQARAPHNQDALGGVTGTGSQGQPSPDNTPWPHTGSRPSLAGEVETVQPSMSLGKEDCPLPALGKLRTGRNNVQRPATL